MATIIVGDDERTVVKDIVRDFQLAGHEVLVARSGDQLLEAARRVCPDLVVLGDSVGGRAGLDLCRSLRAESAVPITLVSAKSGEIDRILGLEIGADEYLVKPVSARELLARLHALLRRIRLVEERGAMARGDLLRSGDLSIDRRQHLVLLASEVVPLKPKEFDLLAFLVAHRGVVQTREQLLRAVWGYRATDGTRTVDIHVRGLREKIEPEPSKPVRLQTVRGVGYRFVG